MANKHDMNEKMAVNPKVLEGLVRRNRKYLLARIEADADDPKAKPVTKEELQYRLSDPEGEDEFGPQDLLASLTEEDLLAGLRGVGPSGFGKFVSGMKDDAGGIGSLDIGELAADGALNMKGLQRRGSLGDFLKTAEEEVMESPWPEKEEKQAPGGDIDLPVEDSPSRHLFSATDNDLARSAGRTRRLIAQAINDFEEENKDLLAPDWRNDPDFKDAVAENVAAGLGISKRSVLGVLLSEE